MSTTLFLILCALAIAQAQFFPTPWMAANFTGSTTINPSGGSFNIKGWFASHFDAATSLARYHSVASVNIGGQDSLSETLVFARNGITETYVIAMGRCQKNRQYYNPATYKECMEFTWSDSLFHGQACVVGVAECEVVDNTTRTSVHMRSEAYMTNDKKTPLGGVTKIHTDQIDTETELVFSNPITFPLPDSYFAIPSVCNAAKQAKLGFTQEIIKCPDVCRLWPNGCDSHCRFNF